MAMKAMYKNQTIVLKTLGTIRNASLKFKRNRAIIVFMDSRRKKRIVIVNPDLLVTAIPSADEAYHNEEFRKRGK